MGKGIMAKPDFKKKKKKKDAPLMHSEHSLLFCVSRTVYLKDKLMLLGWCPACRAGSDV